MENIKHPTEIDKLYNDKEITLKEASELRDKWGNLSESEKKITPSLYPNLNQQVQKYLIEKFKKKYLKIYEI